MSYSDLNFLVAFLILGSWFKYLHTCSTLTEISTSEKISTNNLLDVGGMHLI